VICNEEDVDSQARAIFDFHYKHKHILCSLIELKSLNFWHMLHCREEESGGHFRKDFHIFFVPRKSLLCEKKLKVCLFDIIYNSQFYLFSCLKRLNILIRVI